MNASPQIRETRNLEFKRDVSNTFLKTVSAFANFGTGAVLFGVEDDGNRIGLQNPADQALMIENKINNAIAPIPDFTLTVENDGVIALTVYRGEYRPYTYKGKAYKRADSSTVEVSRVELNRLILDGLNISFEELPARQQTLQFYDLEGELSRVLGVSELSTDVLKTLDLYSEKQGFNHAAELLADTNSFPGVDIARFGETIDVIKERLDLQGTSLISQLQQSLAFFEREYTFEQVQAPSRVKVESIPSAAFREALANALIHRTWDVPATTRVSFFPDYIEITSPGGLPAGVSKSSYLNGQLSLLRNPILGTVFFRLGYIEKFGTGIARIRAAYAESITQPDFMVNSSSITVRLPALQAPASLSARAQKVLTEISASQRLSRSQLEEATGLSSTTLQRALKELIHNKKIEKLGSGPATQYQILF